MLPGGWPVTVTGGAEQSLDVELRQETRFLARYTAFTAAVVERFDARGSDLSPLIVGCIDHDNVICIRRRDPFSGRVPAAFFGAHRKDRRTNQTRHGRHKR